MFLLYNISVIFSRQIARYLLKVFTNVIKCQKNGDFFIKKRLKKAKA